MVGAKSPGLEGLMRLSEVQWQVLEKVVDERRAQRRSEDAERGEA